MVDPAQVSYVLAHHIEKLSVGNPKLKSIFEAPDMPVREAIQNQLKKEFGFGFEDCPAYKNLLDKFGE